jgi:hypothetical protein
MTPAEERLYTADRVRPQINYRLVMQHELLPLESVP